MDIVDNGNMTSDLVDNETKGLLVVSPSVGARERTKGLLSVFDTPLTRN